MDLLPPILSSNRRLLAAVGIALLLHGALFLLLEGFVSVTPRVAAPKPPREMAVTLSTTVSTGQDTQVGDNTARNDPTPNTQAAAPANTSGTSDEAPTQETAEEDSTPEKTSPEPKKTDETSEKAVEPSTDENVPETSSSSAEDTQATESGASGNEFSEDETSSKASSAPQTSGRATPAESTAPNGSTHLTWSGLTSGRMLPKPEYPAAAKRFGYEGIVRVAISIGSDGEVTGVDVTGSSGHRMLDREVVSTIRSSWSFHPPGRNIKVIKEFAFRLEE